MKGLGMTSQTPSELELDSTNTFTLHELKEGHPKFDEIKIDFEKAGLKVNKVEEVKNNDKTKLFVTEKKLLLDSRRLDPNFAINEKYLYHGTTAEKTYICEQGLDLRKAKSGNFGKGIYFSDFPKKCVKYSKGGGCEGYVCLMRVILGHQKVYAQGEKDKSLVREPEKEIPYKGHRFYDSVEGCPVNHKEFVVYESRRALVDSIISYSAKDAEAGTQTDSATTTTENIKDDCKNNDNSSDEIACASDCSSDEEDDNKGSSSDEEDDNPGSSSSSDAEDDNCQQNDTVNTQGSTHDLLRRKREEFFNATGESDVCVVDIYLLKGKLDVNEAITLYNNKQKEEKNDEVQVVEGTDDKKNDITVSGPDINSPEWQNMSTADKDQVILGLIDNFLVITGLGQQHRDLAKEKLDMANLNLDQAILFFYQSM